MVSFDYCLLSLNKCLNVTTNIIRMQNNEIETIFRENSRDSILQSRTPTSLGRKKSAKEQQADNKETQKDSMLKPSELAKQSASKQSSDPNSSLARSNQSSFDCK